MVCNCLNSLSSDPRPESRIEFDPPYLILEPQQTCDFTVTIHPSPELGKHETLFAIQTYPSSPYAQNVHRYDFELVFPKPECLDKDRLPPQIQIGFSFEVLFLHFLSLFLDPLVVALDHTSSSRFNFTITNNDPDYCSTTTYLVIISFLFPLLILSQVTFSPDDWVSSLSPIVTLPEKQVSVFVFHSFFFSIFNSLSCRQKFLPLQMLLLTKFMS